MRCQACDTNLSDYESTRKDLQGRYLDLCNSCFGTVKREVLVVEREDLLSEEEAESEVFTNYEEDL